MMLHLDCPYCGGPAKMNGNALAILCVETQEVIPFKDLAVRGIRMGRGKERNR